MSCIRMAGVCLVLAAALRLQSADNAVLIHDITLHPVTSAPVDHMSVLVTDGKIAFVGKSLRAPRGTRLVEGQGLHLYPGLINAATNVGLSEIAALRDSVDLDEMGLFNPELRAAVAFNPSSEHIPVTRASGITSVVSLPGSGQTRSTSSPSVIAGQGALMHLDGWTSEDMAVDRAVVMDIDFPEIPLAPAQHGVSAPPNARSFRDAEKSYESRIREISRFFEDARRYQQAKAAPSPDFRRDVKLEAMLPVLDRKQPLFVRAERERAIKDAVAFAVKENVKIILANPQEIGSIGPLLKQHNIPVIVGKVLSLPARDDDPYDAPYTLAAEFYKAGVKICFGTFDVEFARNGPFEAAQAVAFGLPPEEALKALTIDSAEILGVAGQLGSIEKGKIADLILTDGDPLETRTNIRQMFIAGRPVSLESRHTREYEKWMNRPRPSR